MVKQINFDKIKHDAEKLYLEGEFYCSEAIVKTIKDHIANEMPDVFIAGASGFPVGVGGSQCMCGAVSGAVMCLGYFFGRTKAGNEEIAKSQKTMNLSNELQDSFRKRHKGVLCCHIHVKNFLLASPEHIKQCAEFTGEMAKKTAEIIARELNIGIKNS